MTAACASGDKNKSGGGNDNQSGSSSVSASGGQVRQSWRTASRESMGIAPKPDEVKEALVHVYVARAYGWRRHFGVHSWVATKEKDADHYTTYHVTAWGLRRSDSTVSIEQDVPDRKWFGNDAHLIAEVKGEKAEAAIPKIKSAAESYPYHKKYRVYPGPNSNTFVSYILRHTPEIGVELPPNAIGKDWIKEGQIFGLSETHTGVQFSLLGLLGFTVGLSDGIELNVLSMSFGVDVVRPALKLPFVGRIGVADAAWN